MLTGDRKAVAEKVAGQLGIDKVYSELLPGDKVQKVEELLADKRNKLAFVGDGINDAPVLARADIGIAMGALGADAAIEAADVVLMDDSPMKIVKAIRISKKCIRIVKENIVGADWHKAYLPCTRCAWNRRYVACYICRRRSYDYRCAECNTCAQRKKALTVGRHRGHHADIIPDVRKKQYI